MIPDNNNNTARIPETFESVGFGIDNEDFSHIVDILQNQLYSDKPLALVREYACNAYDANVAAGKKDTPIRITLPSKFSPHLKFRDFGTGLSYEDMKLIFTRYGKSTKRGDNNSVGCFGIGSKCAFAYTPNFLIHSYQKGIKTAYSCVLTETKAGDLVKLSSNNTNEADGLEVIINIKSDDIELFRNICIKFFKHWTVMPEIEGFTADDYKAIRGEDTVQLSGNGWKIMSGSSGWGRSSSCVAIMGNIAYPVVWNSVTNLMPMLVKKFGKDNWNVQYFITDNNIVFDFGIGDIKMSPSRESLQYTDFTNNALVERVEKMLDEVAIQAQKKMDTANNLWEAKSMYNELFGDFGGLYRLMGSIKLNYNGKMIDNNKIVGFEKIGDVKTGTDVVLKTYHRRNVNSNHYCYPCGEYAWNSIECGKKRIILEIDQTEKVYVQKAVKYLAAIKDAASVYVLTFKDAAQRTAVFKDTGLDDSFIVKYSSIASEVKNTIVRNSSTGVSRVDKESSTRNVRYVSSSNLYNWRYCKTTDFSTKEIDITKGGVYIETNANELVNSNMSIKSICDIIGKIGKYDNKEVEVYFIGQNLIGGKLMSKGTWIKFSDYIKGKVDMIVSKNKTLSKMAAFDSMVNKNDIFSLDPDFIKILKGIDGISSELKELISFSSDKQSTERAIVVGNIKVEDADKNYITNLFDAIYSKYPLINVLNNIFRWGFEKNDLKKVEEYIKSNS
jgi:hypothetical protein